MQMISLNGKFFYYPAFLLALGFDDLATILCNFTNKHWLAAFGGPDQMEQEKVYPVFVPFIV
jgi:hypothetical protein